MQSVAKAARAGDFELKDSGCKIASQYELGLDDFDLQYKAQEGFDCASEDGVLVSLDLHMSDELILEGHAREIIRHMQTLRKEAQYELSDRIVGFVQSQEKLIQDAAQKHSEMIAGEVLAKELNLNDVSDSDVQKEVSIDGLAFIVGVKKV